ncbi:MAG: serine protease [Phycisphaerales bacterium]|nr:MAG: serine protease [Phycisphaerales bacterium]
MFRQSLLHRPLIAAGARPSWRSGGLGSRYALRSVLLCAALVIVSGVWAASARADDMPKVVHDHVRHATLLVLTEVPGTEGSGSGTGEFINGNGLLITNNHVVDLTHGKSVEERAELADKLTLPRYHVIIDSGTDKQQHYIAELLHQSEPTDLALLQIKDDKGKFPDTPHFLRFAPEGTLQKHLKTWVFGFPGGLSRDNKVAETFGLITELVRSQSGLVNYVQSDATAHPGNSGGPLVDVNGYQLGVLTHGLFREGTKNLSGAVPVHMVEDFLRTAFYDGRVPEDADVLPFVDIFTDQDGIVEFPHIPRDRVECTVHYSSGRRTVKGKLLAPTLTVSTALGPMVPDLGRAAYLFVQGRQATLVMDGGDRLAFPCGQAKIALEFSGQKQDVALGNVSRIAFARPDAVVRYPKTKGLIIETGDGTRLGLSEVTGKVSVGAASFPLGEVCSIESEGRGRHAVSTTDGQRVPGTLADTTIQARTIWSDKPVSIKLNNVDRAAVRPVDWLYINARGRRLVERLDTGDDDLRRIAELLDSPKWEEALPLLEAAEKNRGRSREERRNLKLLGGVAEWRAGKYEQAESVLRRFKGGRDQARWVAEAYMMLLDEHPDHVFKGEPLSDPDTVWRASTYKARAVLAEARGRYKKALELDYDKNADELKDLEEALEVADRLELGIAQSLLMQVLRAQIEAHWYGYNQMVDEYNEIVEQHNDQRFRAQQHKYARRLRSLERKLNLAEEEAQRAYERYAADVTGFVVEPPKFDRDRR